MSAPGTTERVRLEYDDGSGIDFATKEDVLFFLCYGHDVPLHDGQPKLPTTMLGVKHVCTVVHTDTADPVVIGGQPFLNHIEPVHGDVIWDRAKLDELVRAAHADDHPDLPVVEGIAGLGVGDPGELTEHTIDALAEVVAMAEEA